MRADLEQALAKGLEKVGRGSEVPNPQRRLDGASRKELLNRISQLEEDLKRK